MSAMVHNHEKASLPLYRSNNPTLLGWRHPKLQGIEGLAYMIVWYIRVIDILTILIITFKI